MKFARLHSSLNYSSTVSYIKVKALPVAKQLFFSFFIYQNKKNLQIPGIYHFQGSDISFSIETSGSQDYFYLFPCFWGTVKDTHTVTDLRVS